jgi:hypothetical protein
MTREFIYTYYFDKRWDALDLTDRELKALEDYLLENARLGAVVEGTGGLRKIRWQLENKGKSGGIRVLYVDFVQYGKLYMMDVYTKDEKSNLSQSEKVAIKNAIGKIEREVKR